MVGHWGIGEGEVALYEDGRSPPFSPGVVSSGVGPEFGWSDGVEFRYRWVSRVVEYKCVWLGLETEGVIFDFGWEEGNVIGLLSATPDCRRLDSVNGLEKGLGRRREERCHSRCVVRLSIFCGCEKLVEGMDNGFAEVVEAFCRVEACECRAIYGAWVAGRFRRGVVCSDYGGDLLKEAGAEVFWEVGGDERVWDRGGPWGLPASKEEQAH